MKQQIIWDHIKTKRIETLQGYTFDVSALRDEFIKEVIEPQSLRYNAENLLRSLKEAVAYASTLESKLSGYQIAPLRADEFETLLNATQKSRHSYYCFDANSASDLHKQLEKHHPDFDRLGLSKTGMVVNHTNAGQFFSFINYHIHPDADYYPLIHQFFNELRLTLSPEEHLRYFNCAKESKGPFNLLNPNTMLTSFLDAAFDISKSDNSAISYEQLWSVAQRLTEAEQISLFGQAIDDRSQDIPTQYLDYHQLFVLAKQHDILFDLEPHQYRRLISKLTLSQASYLGEITLAKAAGFSENTLQSGSQYIGAYGFEASKFMKIFGALLGTAANCSVLIQRATMPVLGALGLMTAKWHYDAQIELEAQQVKTTSLAFLSKNVTREKVQREQEKLVTLERKLPYDKQQSIHNAPSHYLVLRSWVQKMDRIPARLSSLINEQTHLIPTEPHADLLCKLARCLMETPKERLATEPNIAAFVSLVTNNLPHMVPSFHHAFAHSAYNPKHKQKTFPKLSLQWLTLCERIGQFFSTLKPSVAPIASALFTGMALCFIIWMFTVNVAIIAIGTVVGALISGVLRAISDNKQAKVSQIVQYAEHEEMMAKNLEQCSHDTTGLCEIINIIADPEGARYGANLGKLHQHNTELASENTRLKKEIRNALQARRSVSSTENTVSKNSSTLFSRPCGLSSNSQAPQRPTENTTNGYGYG